MKRLLLVGLVVVSGCGQAAKTGPAASSVATAAASISASPSRATATASAGLSAGFACRLPLANFEDGSGGYPTGTVKPGFVTFPGGVFALDPNGVFETVTTNGWDKVKSVAKPYLYGGPWVATFTRRFGRWLPASPAAVSPDSSHYAYAESYNDANGPRSRIHVVDVASAADRVVYDQGFYAVIDYESDGIYLFTVGYADAPNRGLWRLDPQTRSLTQVVSENLTVDYVGGGGAWYSELAPGDQPPSSLDQMAQHYFKDRVMRLDLKSSVVSPWFRQPGKDVRTIGVDALGHPVATVVSPTDPGSSTSYALWLVTGPDRAKQIYTGPGVVSPDFVGFGTPLADSHGLWFGSRKGVFLYTADGKLWSISSALGEVAGRCS